MNYRQAVEAIADHQNLIDGEFGQAGGYYPEIPGNPEEWLDRLRERHEIIQAIRATATPALEYEF